MTKFIIIPIDNSALISMKSPSGMSGGDRHERLTELEEYRKGDSVSGPVMDQIELARTNLSAEVSLAGPEALPILGATVLEAEADAEGELENLFRNALVVEDFTLTTPKFADDSDTDEDAIVDDSENWHLESVEVLSHLRSNRIADGQGVNVAILDSGIQPVDDLCARIKGHYVFKKKELKKVCKSGDSNGHGTFVAGVVAGRQTGIAPGAGLTNVRISPNLEATSEQFVQAVELVLRRKDISIFNLSAGVKSPDRDPKIARALELIFARVLKSNVLGVVSIGNSGPGTTNIPGRLESAFAVGATKEAGGLWHRSAGGYIDASKSKSKPNIIAPGARVRSCYIDGTYTKQSGTSIAAGVVSGLAALILSAKPNLSPLELRELIVNYCVPLNEDRMREGAGKVRYPAELIPDFAMS